VTLQKIILSVIDRLQAATVHSQLTMGKKRKAGGRPAQKDDIPMRTKYSIEERFEDSEDEFQANRDQILLEEAPEAKRRRRVAEDGTTIAHM
jgi:U3 small nucleolar RNA-associated protein 3